MIIWIPGIPKTAQTGNIIRTKDGRVFKKRANSEWFAYVRLAISQAKVDGTPLPLSGPLAAVRCPACDGSACMPLEKWLKTVKPGS